MKVLTIQSKNLKINNRIYANDSHNHKNAWPIYKRLFNDYNKKYNTNYTSFFWGFSKLMTNNLKDAVIKAASMIGFYKISEDNTENVIILDIPDEICLETDFYNFTDEIYAYQYPDELSSIWESIYDDRISEKQVIFPYIDKNMVIEIFKLNKFIGVV